MKTTMTLSLACIALGIMATAQGRKIILTPMILIASKASGISNVKDSY